MNKLYTMPDIYIEEVSHFAPAVPLLSTCSTAFLGTATSDSMPLHEPVNIDSMATFTRVFGEQLPLFKHLPLFFANGGRECIVMVTPDGLVNGLSQLKQKSEPNLLVVPEATSQPPEIYATLVQAMLKFSAEAENCFTILDVYEGTRWDVGDIARYRADTGSDNLNFGASYFPSLLLDDGQILPPSAAIAGVYCQSDADRGVWKSPANVALAGVAAPVINIDKQTNELLNVDVSTGKSINVIRAFAGRGVLVWGARTLDGNSNEWRYVAIQRLHSWIKACLVRGVMQFAFTENNPSTWIKVRGMIENFLTVLWKEGALQGAKTDEAFFVHAGVGQTMTAADIAEGRMIVEVGFAPVRPAEFMIIRIQQLLQV